MTIAPAMADGTRFHRFDAPVVAHGMQEPDSTISRITSSLMSSRSESNRSPTGGGARLRQERLVPPLFATFATIARFAIRNVLRQRSRSRMGLASVTAGVIALVLAGGF